MVEVYVDPRILFIFILFGIFHSCQTPHKPSEEHVERHHVPSRYKLDTLKIRKAKEYCKQHGFNEEMAFFLDMDIRSGRKRFFVVDLTIDSIVDAGLVAHGHCQNYTSRKPSFSNEVGSNCTSLGKYRVGYKYDGGFGTAYKLHGLEPTNSNAFDRYVVLHSHSCVPETESVVGICRSEGCPTVSPAFLSRLETHIDGSALPMLLWVFSD